MSGADIIRGISYFLSKIRRADIIRGRILLDVLRYMIGLLLDLSKIFILASTESIETII